MREHVETFDPTEVLERIRAFLPDGKFMVELPDGFRLYTAGMIDWNLDNAREVRVRGAARPARDARRRDLARARARRVLHIVERMGLHQVSYAIGWTAWLDIAPDGVNKATALERVRGWLDLPLDRVLAVGDGRNDLEMFAWAGAAGRAVAMGQAPDEVRAAATETAADRRGRLAAVLDSLP